MSERLFPGTDPYTGKEIPDLSSRRNGSYCNTCKTELIDRCRVCGAPQCCPKCCWEAEQEQIAFEEKHL